ncbi:DUF1475 family protein [Mariniplasma anaerobium]|uniref:DUF1475 domain-containing protein n=1 Tax=Mariniplasma anaerobium TaxID=2735436 RepID=A0A7U9XV76_9MOLU|nr:DUF1475 family protein [Mariniplasma anaerobium]BCR36646.1 hypothetical protein MPAN_015390 [Mariniplasma anaerobium]
MKIAKIISGVGALAMTIALLNGFINGSFFDDGSIILNNPWGIVSLVDLYVGFIIFSMWIYFREEKKVHSILWIISVMLLGFFSVSIYVLIALFRSHDNWLDFFLGYQKDTLVKKLNQK